MEILLIIAVAAFAGWWFFWRTPEEARKVDTAPVNSKTGDTVETAPSWHTAPPEETKPVTVETVAVAEHVAVHLYHPFPAFVIEEVTPAKDEVVPAVRLNVACLFEPNPLAANSATIFLPFVFA